MDEIKTCPFCGAVSRPFERDNPMSRWRWSVDCTSGTCGASGPVEASRRDAVIAWNKRAGEDTPSHG